MTRIELQVQLHKDITAFAASMEVTCCVPMAFSPGVIWLGSQDTELEQFWDAFANMVVEQVNKYLPKCDFTVDVQCFDKEMEISF